jgi:serine/threonine protein kinase
VNVYKAFSKPQTNHHNIATAVGSIIYGTDGDLLTVKSIFFKLAKFDLDGYLQNQDIFPGSKRVSETLHDIRQMVDICHALAWLSKLLSYHSPSDSIKLDQYYHGDLKPANILVYGNPSQYNTLVFKISDFGETQRWNLHIDPKKSRIPEFFRKVLIHQTSVDTRPGTYCAPEKALGERSDIWSFGCIFLLVIAANIDGHCAVEYFSNARRGRNQKCSNENCDWFFEDDDKMQERKVNEEVTQYIKDFIKYCNNTGDGMTETCLKLIRDEMIQPKPRHRTSAEDLYKKLAASYNERHAVKFVSIDHDRELTKGEKVCSAAISPSGKLEAFLCTNTIYVWNTQLSRYNSKPIMLHTTSVDGNGGFKPILLCGEDMVCKIGSIAGSLQVSVLTR